MSDQETPSLETPGERVTRLENWLDQALKSLNRTVADLIARVGLLEAATVPAPLPSSVLRSGLVIRPSESGAVSQAATGALSVPTERTGEVSKSMPFTVPEWVAYLKVSSILQQMYELRTTSGLTKAGDPGPASPECLCTDGLMIACPVHGLTAQISPHASAREREALEEERAGSLSSGSMIDKSLGADRIF